MSTTLLGPDWVNWLRNLAAGWNGLEGENTARARAIIAHVEELQAQHDRLLAFVDAVSPFVRDVLDEPFPWKEGGQVSTWMSRAEYDEALATLGALRD